jgi:hypothetical protein
MNKSQAAAAYEASLIAFRAASRDEHAAAADYHARKIGDASYLAARAKREAAGKACDAAEAQITAFEHAH